MQLQVLANCVHKQALDDALLTLPDTLNGTYQRILESINYSHFQDVYRALQWLSYSARPLDFEELRDAIATETGAEPHFNLKRQILTFQDIITVCSSLVTLALDPKTLKVRVRLTHFTVKDYIASEECPEKYRMPHISSMLSLAKVCLVYLLQFDSPLTLKRTPNGLLPRPPRRRPTPPRLRRRRQPRDRPRVQHRASSRVLYPPLRRRAAVRRARRERQRQQRAHPERHRAQCRLVLQPRRHRALFARPRPARTSTPRVGIMGVRCRRRRGSVTRMSGAFCWTKAPTCLLKGARTAAL